MDIRKTIAFLKNNELFKGLELPLLEQIAASAQWLRLEKGEYLFKEGQQAEAMYLAVEPGLMVTFTDDAGRRQCATVTPCETVGEMQFITGGKRSASIHAEEASSVVRLPISLLDTLGENRAPFLERLDQTVHRRLFFNEMLEFLPCLFGKLEKDEIIAIMKQAELVRIPRGELLFDQGDPADGFYILMAGSMAIEKQLPEGERIISTYVQRGEILGEMALLAEEGSQLRAAGVRAMRDSELYQFPVAGFYQFLEDYPKLLMQITRILADRLRRPQQVRQKRQAHNKLITVLSVQPGLDARSFTDRLKLAFTDYGSSLLVNGGYLDAQLCTPGIAQSSDASSNRLRLSHWFEAQEKQYDFLLLQADEVLTQWSRRCIRMADHIILLAPGRGGVVELGPMEEHVFHHNFLDEHSRARTTLVFLHPDGERLPEGTRDWLASRDVTGHFHLRMDREQDFHRLARHLAGKSVGLVLSGGGARGFAHIGVMNAMRRRGIPIDVIGGTSMGAVLAAEYALGWSLKRITEETGGNLSRFLFDYTLPLTSLFAGRRLALGLKGLFGDVHVEDMWLPFFCVSSNLTRARQKVHEQGLLWPAIQASNSAPGILPPVVMEGDLHVDGALLNNLPVDVMDRMCNGSVIAVDVSPAVDLQEIAPYGNGLSGWRLLWHKLNPFMSPLDMPGIQSILRRSGELASISNQQMQIKQHADLYLRMPIDDFPQDNYKAVEDIVRTGYDYARERLDEFFV